MGIGPGKQGPLLGQAVHDRSGRGVWRVAAQPVGAERVDGDDQDVEGGRLFLGPESRL